MNRHSKEFLVGLLCILVVALLAVFGWLMGAIGPFVHEVHYTALYSFAGGVEVGSPVRVSGVKVGKVDKIEFLPQASDPGDRATLRLRLSVSEKASPAVRKDSKFYVNMAGIIGERYVEISPGSNRADQLPDGAEVRGIDPPRIDQLISQGYGVFGKIQALLEENEDQVTDFIKQTTDLLTTANHLLGDANKILKGSDKEKFVHLVDNLNVISDDVRGVTKGLHDERTKKFVEELFLMVHRGSEIDKQALKKFLQDEGVRARLF